MQLEFVGLLIAVLGATWMSLRLINQSRDSLLGRGVRFSVVRTLMAIVAVLNLIAHLIGAQLSEEPRPKPRPGRRLHAWLDAIGFFIPRSVRAPFWDHLLEDRDQMVRDGRGATFVRIAICSQFLLLMVLATRDIVMQAVGLRSDSSKN